jgi:hypothetical protein
MTSTSMKPDSLQPAADMAVDLFDNWFDPLEVIRCRKIADNDQPTFCPQKFRAISRSQTIGWGVQFVRVQIELRCISWPAVAADT